MKIYKEVSARDFDFWSGAKDTVKYLTYEEMDTIFSLLEDENPDGMGETELNDFFWFEDDTIADWLGWDDFDTIMKARSDGNWYDTQEEWEEAQEEEENDTEIEEEEDEIEDGPEYGPSNPWDAPGMSVSDFIRGVH